MGVITGGAAAAGPAKASVTLPTTPLSEKFHFCSEATSVSGAAADDSRAKVSTDGDRLRPKEPEPPGSPLAVFTAPASPGTNGDPDGDRLSSMAPGSSTGSCPPSANATSSRALVSAGGSGSASTASSWPPVVAAWAGIGGTAALIIAIGVCGGGGSLGSALTSPGTIGASDGDRPMSVAPGPVLTTPASLSHTSAPELLELAQVELAAAR